MAVREMTKWAAPMATKGETLELMMNVCVCVLYHNESTTTTTTKQKPKMLKLVLVSYRHAQGLPGFAVLGGELLGGFHAVATREDLPGRLDDEHRAADNVPAVEHDVQEVLRMGRATQNVVDALLQVEQLLVRHDRVGRHAVGHEAEHEVHHVLLRALALLPLEKDGRHFQARGH